MASVQKLAAIALQHVVA